MTNYTCPSECLFANHPGKEHDSWIAENEVSEQLDQIIRHTEPYEEAVRVILDEFIVIPKRSDGPIAIELGAYLALSNAGWKPPLSAHAVSGKVVSHTTTPAEPRPINARKAVGALDDIRARAEAATDGPWEHNATGACCGSGTCIEGSGGTVQHAMDYVTWTDAEFIAHARTDVPRLLAALEAVQELARVRQNLGCSLVPEEIQQAIAQALA